MWLDKGQRACLVLWRSLPGWADVLWQWARASGMENSVATIDDLSSGDDVRGTGAVFSLSMMCAKMWGKGNYR